jgi:diaminopimelate decarboxylase
MLVSNERQHGYMAQTVAMLLELIESIAAALGIRFEFMNMGGGLGIPYRPGDEPLDIAALARDIDPLCRRFREAHGYLPRLFMESGRFMTGPHGALVVRAINRKEIYRTYIGVDATMAALMRPAMYGAYHHITVPAKLGWPPAGAVDVVGSLCENNDKFAIQRELPAIEDGDLLVIHDTGAHGHAMGFNYNGKLRPKELLLRADGAVELIRREETVADYFATLAFAPNLLALKN